ncbi:MAG: mechanosensitive ion channel family protein [Desulfosarcinaceae bacterium]|nr:mechanosensitive ion channel family protein [Desulfosarcinaceae bacterium]
MPYWNAILDFFTAPGGKEMPFLILIYKAGGTLLMTGLCWLIVKKLLSTLEKRREAVRIFTITTEMIELVRKALFYLLLLVTLNILIRLLQLKAVEPPLYAIFIILLAGPVKSALIILLSALERHLASRTETKADDILFDLLNKFAGVILYSIAIVLSLDMLGINVMPFVAGAGVLGVAVGFAAKDTLSNLIAGILLIIDRPFEVGDRIEVWSAPTGSATWGDVIDVGLRATRIKTTDNIVIIIPNNQIMMRDIVNYTTITTTIRVRINIGVGYGTDIEHAKQLITDVAMEADWVLRDPAPKVVVRNFGESSVDLQLRVWIANARRRMDTISHVTDRVHSVFTREGIEIPYPKRDIQVVTSAAQPPDQRAEPPMN